MTRQWTAPARALRARVCVCVGGGGGGGARGDEVSPCPGCTAGVGPGLDLQAPPRGARQPWSSPVAWRRTCRASGLGILRARLSISSAILSKVLLFTTRGSMSVAVRASAADPCRAAHPAYENIARQNDYTPTPDTKKTARVPILSSHPAVQVGGLWQWHGPAEGRGQSNAGAPPHCAHEKHWRGRVHAIAQLRQLQAPKPTAAAATG